MSQKMALLLSAALTVFVVIVAGALAVRLGGTTPAATQIVEPTQAAQRESEVVASPDTLDVLVQREERYRQHVEEANTRMRQASDQMSTLQTQLQHLQGQNATLLEREQTYQQRLQEANRLLERPVPAPPVGSDGVSGQWQEAKRATDSSRAWSVRARKPERQRESNNSRRGHHEEEEDDD